MKTSLLKKLALVLAFSGLSSIAFSQKICGPLEVTVQPEKHVVPKNAGSSTLTTKQPSPAVLTCVDNDDCTTAATITLNAAGGAAACTTDCNTGAAMGIDFVGNNCEDMGGATAWYTFTTSANTVSLDISVTSAALNNPEFTLWSNTCSPWTYISGSCTEGTAGSATLTGLVVSPNTTYILSVSDVNGAEGTFNLCITQNADNSTCNTNDALVVTATSMGSPLAGPYKAGEIVTFCYSITDWQTGPSCQYLQGIVPTFGDCWDPVSFTAQGEPVNVTVPLQTAGVIINPSGPPQPTDPCAGQSAGTWSWYPAGAVTYNTTSAPLAAGWFFVTSYDSNTGDGDGIGCSVAPTDPDNSYGDNDFPTCNNTLDWQVCFQLQVKSDGVTACTNGETDCSVTIKTYADAEIGSYTTPGCANDAPTPSPSTNLCCTAPPTVTSPVNYCQNAVASPLTATGTSLQWYTSATGGGGSATAPTPSTATIGTTTYYVSQTTSGCEGARDSIKVVVTAPPTVTVSGTTSICSGQSTTLTAATASSYQWSANAGSATTNTVSVSPAATTVYTVTGTTGACSTSQTVTVTVNATPTVTVSGTTSICSGSSTTLTAGTATTYTWSANAGSATTNTVTVSPATTTTYTVTGANGTCTDVETVTVNVTATPTVSISGTNTICNGGSTTLTAATAGSYTWSANAGSATTNTVSVSPAATTTYTVTGTTGTCTASATYVVTVNPLPNANAGSAQTITCSSSSVALNGSSASSPVSYSWAGPGIVSGGATATPTVNAAGTYTLTVTNTSTNCTNTATVSVTTNTTIPNANAGLNQTITCASPTVTLSGSSSTPGATFAWTGPTAGTPAGIAATTSVTASGTYTLTVTDPVNGCTNTATVSVTTNTTAPNVNAGLDQTLTCATTTVTLSGSSSTGGATFAWTGPTAGTPAGTTPNAASTNVSATGTYTLTVTNPANGCTATDAAVVNPDANIPNVSTGANQTITCTTTTVTLSASSTTGGVTYAWTGPAAGTPAGTTPNASTTNVTAAGTYTVTITNPANGCSNTGTVLVSTNTTVPNANAGSNQTITCATPTVTLSGSSTTGGVTFAWTGPTAGTPAGTTPNASSTNVTASGTYTLTVTNPVNGCTNTGTVSVTTNTATPNVNAGSNQTITCATPTVTLSGSSATGGATFAWTGPTAGTPAGSTPNASSTNVTVSGTYTLTVTDPANSCANTSTVSVTTNTTIPNASAGSNQTITCATPTVTLTGSSTTGGATYAWTGPTTGTPAGSTPASSATDVAASGTYTLTVTDPSNSCTNTATVSVTTNTAIPNANAGSNQTITCTTGTVTLSGSSTTGGVTFAWTGPGAGAPAGTTPASASTDVTAGGTYTLTVTDPSNSCSNTATVTVATNTTVPNVNAGSNQTITCTTPTVTLAGNSTTTGAMFAWEGPTTGTPAGTTPASATTDVTAGGTYTLTVADPANGCTNSATVSVTTNTTVPDVNGGSDQILTCASPTVTLTGSSATPGATFSWEGPGAGTPAGNAPTSASTDVTATGTYTLTITDPSNGCTATDQVIVTPDANLPNVNAGATQTITCSITTVTLSGSSSTPNVSFAWTGPSVIGGANNDTAVVDAAGTYTLTATDNSNGCSNNSTVLVAIDTASPSITFAATPQITCANDTVLINASSGAGNAQFSWSGTGIVAGSSSDTATINTAGTFTLTITDPSNGCSETDSVVVTANTTAPGANAGADVNFTCAITTLDLVGTSTSPNATYSWSGAGIISTTTNDTITVNSSGQFILTVTDANNGCSGTDTVNVIPDANLPSVNAGNDQIITCNTASASLDGSSTTSGAAYSWNGPGGFTSASDTVTVTVPGSYTLTVTDTSNGCSNSDIVIVNDSTQLPGANAGADDTLTCSVTSLNLSAGSSASNVSYLWNGPSGFTSSSQTTSVTTAGTYTLTVTNINTGCTSTDTVIISGGTGIPNVNAGNNQQITCATTTATLNGSSGTTGVTYSWSGPNGFTSSSATPTVSDSGTYTLTVTDPANGCSASATVYVALNNMLPNAGATTSANALTCITDSVVLSGNSTTNGVTLAWSGPSGGLSGNPVTVTATGSYTLTVTDTTNGCVNTDTITINSNNTPPIISAGATADTLNCSNTSSSLSATGNAGYTYNWSGPNGFSSAQQNAGATSDAGTYTVTVTDPSNGCTTTDSVTIIQGPNPVASFVANPTSGLAPLGVTYTNTSSAGFDAYLWTFGNGDTATTNNTSNIFNAPGTYTVTLYGVSASGCSDTATVVINVFPQAFLTAPNIFTPNGDGINELFTIESEGIKTLTVEIFNRWGSKLFEFSGLNSSWDGTGHPDGTYFYILKATTLTDEEIEQQGYFMLTR